MALPSNVGVLGHQPVYDRNHLSVDGLVFLFSYRLNKIWKSPRRREFSLMKARESGPRGSNFFSVR